LYASTRKAEMALVPWSDAQKQAFVESQFTAQTRSYAESHPYAIHEVIMVDGSPCGRLYISRTATSLHILDITIAPSRRNGGIGSRTLTEILQEADQTNKSVSIYVETFNPSRRLFERLRFRIASEDGFMLLLERPCPASDSQESNSSRANRPGCG
jgi:ribosomal protein S18 acetylase RimI-like enzyme